MYGRGRTRPWEGKATADYRMSIEPCGKRVGVVFNGRAVADSREAVILRETRLPPVYYFPRRAVRMDLLRRSDHQPHCLLLDAVGRG